MSYTYSSGGITYTYMNNGLYLAPIGLVVVAYGYYTNSKKIMYCGDMIGIASTLSSSSRTITYNSPSKTEVTSIVLNGDVPTSYSVDANKITIKYQNKSFLFAAFAATYLTCMYFITN